MRNLTRAVVMVGVALLAGGVGAGCGGDDDDSSGDVTTGIAPNKLLSDVTAEEAATACEKVSAGFDAKLPEDKLVRAFCTLLGAASADTKADCETARDACIDQANDGQGAGAGAAAQIGNEGPDCSGDTDLSQCQGTVGELETCVNDTLDQIVAFLDAFSCDDAGTVDPDTLGDMSEFEEPASCAVVDCGQDGPFSSASE